MWIKPFIFTLSLLPLAEVLWRLVNDNLGPDPARTLALETGIWGLYFLLMTLAVTPLRRLSGWSPINRIRRMLGLFSLFYASCHLFIYLAFILVWNFAEFATELAERPYILAGFTAWVLMLPLGITSTHGMIKRLGKKWKKLHRTIYFIAPIVILHFVWLSKTIERPALYGILLAVLLLFRLLPTTGKSVWALITHRVSKHFH